MIKKLRTIALGTVAIAAVIVLFATGAKVAQVWSQAANAQMIPAHPTGKDLARGLLSFGNIFQH